MAIWRALKRIEGGEYLQDGVFIVRYSKLNEVTLDDLAHDIKNANGEATLATAKVDDEKHMLGRLKAAAEATRVTVKTSRRRKRA